MRHVLYTMHFRGQASRSSDNASVLRATTSGTSCTFETSVSQEGAETTLHPAPGDLAFMESEILLKSTEVFHGKGTLTFGDEGDNMVHFSSAEDGRILPGREPGMLAGAVTWRVDGGAGRFASASGFITSLFTLAKSGELSEYQCGLIFLPG